MARPTGTDPVKVTAATSGSATSACPAAPSPSTSSSTPSGRPPAANASASACDKIGVSPLGFQTTALPQSSAGAIFQAGICTGKFHGVITATTPTGTRSVRTSSSGVPDG